MPELPDLAVYQRAFESQVVGQTLLGLRLFQPFVLRTHQPPLEHLVGRVLGRVTLIGKRLALHFVPEHVLVVHLMVAGRWVLLPPGKKLPGKGTLLALDFEKSTVLLTEAGTRRQATAHLVVGPEALAEFDRGGVDLFAVDRETFQRHVGARSHTLKRALTDPQLVSGVGNAYSDEILHRARLSPFQMTQTLDDAGWQRLFDACQAVLGQWRTRLLDEAGGQFPKKVTAFRPDMAVHGKYRQRCRICDSPIQRIIHGKRETNYCPGCQTGGKIYADRSLSRLLKKDWPRTLAELEQHALAKRAPPGDGDSGGGGVGDNSIIG
jgi:formamidopyrimidine-DNA glycosylase